jgi:hypothetical protein
MNRVTVVALGALLAAAPSVRGQSYADTEYVSGKAGYEKKAKGTLVIEESELRFQDKNGALVFTIPMSSVLNATDSREHNEGSFGRKMALGIFASKSEEFLTVKTETTDSAEAVVFKCKKKTAPGMAAKISHHARRIKSASAPSQP